ncbi:MAG: hypothetical protein ABI072_09725 [Edaphobacter sp.]
MQLSAPIRFASFFAVAAGFVFSAAFSTPMHAQSHPEPRAKPSAATPAALPATPPTAAPEIPRTPAQLPAHPASIRYSGGLLTVSASNSSLNQILRDISRQTGMKISGGLIDERVFGEYGPAPASHILSTLLDGTSSNMLLVQSGGAAPAELILTPRQGGPTPPNPNAAALNDTVSPGNPAPMQPFPGKPSYGSPAGTPGASAPLGEGGFAPDPNQPQSPNGVKTPQQIYDQLQKLRQQQQQQPNRQ